MIYFDDEGVAMRTTVILDDKLVNEAKELADIKKTSPLLNLALGEYVRKENQHRLAKLGSSVPDLTPVPRKRHSL
jgi:Arc/MetJ family transcription regulator